MAVEMAKLVAVRAAVRGEWWGFPSDLGGFSLNTRIHVYLRVFTLIRVF